MADPIHRYTTFLPMLLLALLATLGVPAAHADSASAFEQRNIEVVGIIQLEGEPRALVSMEGASDNLLLAEGDIIEGFTLSAISDAGVEFEHGDSAKWINRKDLPRIANDKTAKVYTQTYSGPNSYYPVHEIKPEPTRVPTAKPKVIPAPPARKPVHETRMIASSDPKSKAISPVRFHHPMGDKGFVSSSFGWRRAPKTRGGRRGSRFHNGADIAAAYGTTVYAACEGVVTKAVRSRSIGGDKGLNIEIRHADGYETAYYHLSRVFVRVGQHVKTLQAIGTEGTTGNSSGPHLHFEIRKDGQPRNPALYVRSLKK